MSPSTQSQTNITSGRGIFERVVFSTMSTIPCCEFLFINVTMLFTLRSNSVFCETSRFILLYNLLFADTVLLVQAQLMYILAAGQQRLTYPVCGVLVMIANLMTVICPLTLVLMCLERYVAVCYPLRHAIIITVKNTGFAVMTVWLISSVNVLTKVLLLLNFPFNDLESLKMKQFCAREVMLLNQMSNTYDQSFTYFLFVSAGVAVICSYIGVMVAARSASTDKASARKARNTLLLHMVQLGLSLSSTLYNPLLILISKILNRVILVRFQIVLYLCVIILPRCLSSFIYGIRDRTIRPILMYHLCCLWRRTLPVPVKNLHL